MNPIKHDWNKVDLELKKKTPLFLYHGENDQVISPKLAKYTYKELFDRELNMSFETESGLEHSLSIKEIEKVREFFNKHMAW